MSSLQVLTCMITSNDVDVISPDLRREISIFMDSNIFTKGILVMPGMDILHSLNREYLEIRSSESLNLLDSLSTLARSLRINLVSGPMIWKSKNGKYYKKTYLFDESGTIRGQYDQCHLPKVESDFFVQGTGPLLFFCGDTKIAILHSYELLFPEYTRSMALSGVQLIIGCGTKAPTSSEGMKIICKARCIENQIFLAGVWIEEDTDMYGTGIFSPSGTEISEKISSWLYGASIDTESLSIMNKRQFLPSRRPDLYHPVTEFRP